MTIEQHTFIESFLRETLDDYKKRGYRAFVPSYLLLALAGAVAVVHYIPGDFYMPLNQDVSATVYSGVLAFNAITLALSWSALGKILETITQKDFCSFLRSSGLLNLYRFYVDMIHGVQVAASVATFAALLVLLVGNIVPDIVHQSLAVATITLTLYAMRWSHGAVQISNDLIWQYAKFDGLDDEEKKALRMVVNND
jgi:hypothetical protein